MADASTLILGPVLTDIGGNPLPGKPITATLIGASIARYTSTGDFIGSMSETTTTAGTGPVAAPVITPGSGGSIGAATYYYAYSAIVAGVETARSPLSTGAVIGASGSADVAILAFPSATARLIYRGTSGAGTGMHLVTTIADNTTLTYHDTTADAGIAAGKPPMTLGGWQLPLADPSLLTPANTLYKVVLNGQSPVYTTSGSWGAGPLTLAAIQGSTAIAAPTVAMTGNVALISGLVDAGEDIVIRLSFDEISTISGEFFPASRAWAFTAAGDGSFTATLPRNDQMNPSGSYYIMTIGKQTQPYYFLAVAGGGTIVAHLTATGSPEQIALPPTGMAHSTTVPPLIDDPVQAPVSLDDDEHNLNARSIFAMRNVTTTAAVAATDDWLTADGTGGAFTVTLPAANARKRPIYIFRINSTGGAITIARAGSDTINGATSATLSSQYAGVVLKPNAAGTAWIMGTFGAASGGTLTIAHNGATVAAEAALNIIDGINASATVVDNSGAGRVDLTLTGPSWQWLTKTANYAVAAGDRPILGDATGGPITLTLPDATNATIKTQLYAVKKKDSTGSTVTIATSLTQTIDGAATKVLASQGQGVILFSDGANWYIAAVMTSGAGGSSVITTQGDLEVGNSSGVATRLGVGSARQFPTPVGSDVAWGFPHDLGSWVPPRWTAGQLAYFNAVSVTSVVIGFMGDSITGNTPSGGLTPPANCIADLATMVGAGVSFTAVNQGVAGSISSEWLPGTSNWNAAIAAFVSAGVRIVSIMLGTNDSSVTNRVAATAYQASMQTIVNTLAASGYIVVLHQPPYTVPGSSAGNFDATSNAYQQAYGAALFNISRNGFTIRMGDTGAYVFFANHTSELLDGIHPTAAGSVDLGQLWANGLLPTVQGATQRTIVQALSLGTNLSITGTTLNAAGGGGGGGGGYAPMVNGDSPGPTPIATTDHQFLMVPLS